MHTRQLPKQQRNKTRLKLRAIICVCWLRRIACPASSRAACKLGTDALDLDVAVAKRIGRGTSLSAVESSWAEVDDTVREGFDATCKRLLPWLQVPSVPASAWHAMASGEWMEADAT